MRFLPLFISGVSALNAFRHHPVRSTLATRSGNITAAEVIHDIEEAKTCEDCQSVLLVLQELANEGDEAYVQVSTEFCIASGEGTDDVCEGFMALEGPILAATIRNMNIPSRTSTLFCNILFGLCDIPSVSNFTVPFPKPKPNISRPVASGEAPIEVVHISDVHVDLSYVVGSNYNCTEGLCCRVYSADDAPNVTEYPAGPWGNHNCDSPLDLEKSLYAAIEKTVPNASFTLFTGDIVEGVQWLTTNSEIVSDIDSCYTHMQTLKQVYGAVGNHEANPVNSFPPAGVHTLANQSDQYMYNTLSENWLQWIGSTGATSAAERYGAYSVLYPGTKLRIISLNTMFYMKENFWLYTPVMAWDPSSQFTWLIEELQAAEDADERVWIIGHMPMGHSDALYDYSFYFDQIVQRYEATIAAMFFGHTHRDQWEISYSNYSDQTSQTATAISYIAPALTPTSGNPPFRVYSVDPVTFGILDYTVYYANMSRSDYQTVGPIWEKYYSVKESYGPLIDPPYTNPAAELVPAFWHNLTEVFVNNDTIFQEYYVRKKRGYDPVTCTGTCKTDEICAMRSSQSQYACYSEDSPVSLKKRSDEDYHRSRNSHAHKEDKCPGSVAAHYFRLMRQDIRRLRQVI